MKKKGIIWVSLGLMTIGLMQVNAKLSKAQEPTVHPTPEALLAELPDSLFEDVKMEDLLDDEVYLKLAYDGWYQEEISTIMRTAMRNKKEAKKHAGYAAYAKQWLPAYGRQPGGDTLRQLIDTSYSEEVRLAVARVVREDLLNKTWEKRSYDASERMRGIRTPGYFRHVEHFPSSGRTHWCAVDPNDYNRIYAVPDGAGLFRTDDGGTNWRCVSDNIPLRAHRSTVSGFSIPVDPDDFDHVFGFMNGGVVYESTDGGDSWRRIEGATHNGFKRGYCFRDAEGHLKFIGCKSSYFQISEDTCKTWTTINIPVEMQDQVNGARKVWVQQVAFDEFDRNRIYLPLGRSILYFDDGCKSTMVNGKRTYNLKKLNIEVYDTKGGKLRKPADYPDDPTLFPLPATQQGFLEVSPLEQGKMWFSCSHGMDGLQSAVYRSEDYGKTWITMHEPAAGIGSGFIYGGDLPNGWVGGFGVSFTDDNYMYGTSMASGYTENGRDFLKSSWGWRSFSKQADGEYYNVTNARHTADNHFIISHKSGRLFRGSDAGFLMVDHDLEIPGRAKNLWHNIGGNMGQMLYYHVAVNEFGDQAMVGNTQDLDIQTWRYGRWGNWRGYEGSEAFFNPFTGVAYFSGGGGGGGQDGSFGLSSWFCRVAKADVTTGSWFMTKRLPQSSSVHFFRIDDVGQTAILLNTPGHMANGVRNMNDVVICRDKGTSTIFIIANDGALMRSDDGGVSFQPIPFNGADAKFSSARLAGDPNNSDILYLGQQGKVLKYYVNESRWDELTQVGLPDIACNQLLFHEGSGDLYFTNNNTAGIYLLENGASEWRYWTKGYNGGKFSGNVSINYTTQELVFSDGGRGVWVADLEHPSDRFFSDGFALKERSNINGVRTLGIDSEWIIPLYYNYKWTVNGVDADCPYQYLTRSLNPGDKVRLQLTLRESPDVVTKSAEFVVPKTVATQFEHRAGTAIYSDGHGKIDLGYNDYFHRDFTIDMWLKPETNGVILSNSQLSSRGDAKGWVLYLDGGVLKFAYAPRNRFSQPTYEKGITQEVTIGGGQVKMGQWTHLAVTMEREGSVKLFINGTQVASGARIIPESCVNNYNLTLLGDLIDENPMQGAADEVKVWNRALTQDELRAEMYSTNGQGAEGLVAHYGFNGATPDADIETFTRKSAAKRNRAVVSHPEQTMPLGAVKAAYAVMADKQHTYESQGQPLLKLETERSGASLGVFAYESAQWQHQGDNLDPAYYERQSLGYLVHSFGTSSPEDKYTLTFFPSDKAFDPNRTYRLYVDNPAERKLFWHEHEWSTLTYDPEAKTLVARDVSASLLFDNKLLVVTLKPAIELKIDGLNEHNELHIYDENKATRRISARTVEGMQEPVGDYVLSSDSLILKVSRPLNFEKGSAQGDISVDLAQLGRFNSPTATYLRGADAKLIPMRVDVVNRITPREIGTSVSFDGGGMAFGETSDFKALNGSNNVTLMSWVRLDTIPAAGNVPLVTIRSTGSSAMGFLLQNGAMRIMWNGIPATYSQLQLKEGEHTGRWVHMAVVFTPKTTYCYLNGACQAANFTFNGYESAGPLMLGMNTAGDKTFRGAFDQVGVWNRALTADEIVKYMHQSVPMNDEGLLAFVNMDDRDAEDHIRESFQMLPSRTYGNVTENSPSYAPYDAVAVEPLGSESTVAIDFPQGVTRRGFVTSFKGLPHNFYNTQYADEVPLNNEHYTLVYDQNGKAVADEKLRLTYTHPSIMPGDSISLMLRPLGVGHEFARHIITGVDSVSADHRAVFEVPYAAMDSACEMMFLTKNIGSLRPISLTMDFAGGFSKGNRYKLSKDDNRIPVVVKVKSGDPAANIRLNLRETDYAAFDKSEIDLSKAESRHYITIDRDKINRHGINTLTVNIVGTDTEEMKIEFFLEPEVKLSLVNGHDENTYIATSPISTLDIKAELVDGYLDGDVELETSSDIATSMNIGNGTLLLEQPVSYEVLEHHTSTMGEMHEGWNLLGNPYLANINLTKHQNVEFNTDEVTKFVYHCNPATGNFEAYDMTDFDPAHRIAPFSAFFVQTRGSGAEFTITPIAKEDTPTKSTLDYYTADEEFAAHLSLISDGEIADHTNVKWEDGASTGFATNEDAHKLWSLNSESNQLYTLSGATPTAITAVPYGTVYVPLGLKVAKPATFEVRADRTSGFGGGIDLMLLDNANGTVTPLNAGQDGYTFTADKPEDLDKRFTLAVYSHGVVGFDSPRADSGYHVYTDNESCTITGLKGDAVISIYRPNGMLAVTENTNLDTHTISLEQGVYVVKIRENEKDYVTKIAVK